MIKDFRVVIRIERYDITEDGPVLSEDKLYYDAPVCQTRTEAANIAERMIAGYLKG